MTGFGASAPAPQLFKQFGITPEKVAKRRKLDRRLTGERNESENRQRAAGSDPVAFSFSLRRKLDGRGQTGRRRRKNLPENTNAPARSGCATRCRGGERESNGCGAIHSRRWINGITQHPRRRTDRAVSYIFPVANGRWQNDVGADTTNSSSGRPNIQAVVRVLGEPCGVQFGPHYFAAQILTSSKSTPGPLDGEVEARLRLVRDARALQVADPACRRRSAAADPL